MQINTFHLGPLETNCYLVHNGEQAIVVDPGGAPNPVVGLLLKEKLELTHILLTHLHFDHTYGASALKKITDAPIYASEEDRPLLRSSYGRGGMWGLPEVEAFNFEGLPVGQEISLLGTSCKVLPTPGHTPGGVCFYFSEHRVVFTGDALFKRSIGRTDFPGGNLEQLLSGIETQLFTLPGETIAYPGHGEATSIGDERLHNPMFDQENRFL